MCGMDKKILSLLQRLLGSGQNTTKDNYAFTCPNKNHRKGKLEIDVANGWWHCWSCSKGGKSFFTLFKWAKNGQNHLTELRTILGVSNKRKPKKDDTTNEVCVLPEDFIPLWNPPSATFEWNACMKYLHSRGITDDDILKFGIGYCESGSYRGTIIIPSYTASGQLNYFTSRAYRESEFPFMNPPVGKDVIGFDLMINWSEPIILVESPFDAITIRRNAIPLFGKTISKSLKRKIIKMGVKKINICLDGDAIHNAINHISHFLGNGLEVSVTELPPDDDATSLGYTRVWEYLNDAIIVDESTLLRTILTDHIHGDGKTYIPRRRHIKSQYKK